MVRRDLGLDRRVFLKAVGLAGIAAAEALGKLSKEEAAKAKENVWNSLDQLRTGPFGQGRHDAKEQIIEQMEEWKVKNSAC